MTDPLLDGYLRWQTSRDYSPKSVKRRRVVLTLFAAHVAPRALAEAGRADIESWIDTLDRLAPEARRHYLSDVRMMYRWAYRAELVDTDPGARIEPMRRRRGLPRPLTHDELRRALEAARGDVALYRILLLGSYCGLRAAEIGALDAEDVWLHATPPVVIVRGGKGGKDRSIPLHPDLVAELADLPNGPVVPRIESSHWPGRPMPPDMITRAVTTHFRALGIRGSCHRLRHTFGTEAARAAGGDVLTVATLMGHSNLNTSMAYIALAGVRGAGVVAQLYGGAA